MSLVILQGRTAGERCWPSQVLMRSELAPDARPGTGDDRHRRTGCPKRGIDRLLIDVAGPHPLVIEGEVLQSWLLVIGSSSCPTASSAGSSRS